MKLFLTLFFVVLNFTAICQTNGFSFPSPSPKAVLSQVVGNTTVTIEYERPLARQRIIFGELVPWNKLWRTGAGECSRISLTKSVQLQGQLIPPGKYALFTIPNPDRWIVILNSDTTLYGSYGYQQQKDVARFVVFPQKTERYFEALTFDIDLVQTNAKIYLAWADVQISFDLLTTTKAAAEQFVQQQLLSGLSKDPDSYLAAAQYLLYENENFFLALQLADKALSLNKNEGGARRVKMEVYERLQMFKEAAREAAMAIEMEKGKKYDREEIRQQEIRYWQEHLKRIEKKGQRSKA